MADTPIKWKPRIEWEEARAILVSRGVPTNCFRCGHEDWVDFQTSDMAAIAMKGVSDDMKELNENIPATGFVCLNCGTIWTLITQVLRGFADETIPKVTG